MTAEDVSGNYHISMDKIQYYEENGLLEHSVLLDGKMEKIKEFMKLFYKKGSDKKGQIQILRKQRFLLPDEIHKKQQALDELDYMIGGLKK